MQNNKNTKSTQTQEGVKMSQGHREAELVAYKGKSKFKKVKWDRCWKQKFKGDWWGVALSKNGRYMVLGHLVPRAPRETYELKKFVGNKYYRKKIIFIDKRR